MDFNYEQIRKNLEDSLNNDTVSEMAFNPFIAEVFKQFISDCSFKNYNNEKIAELFKFLYKVDPVDFGSEQQYLKFMEEMQISSELIRSDELLCDVLKNSLIFDLVELIRFASIQKRNIKDNAAYNRHLEKVLSDMNREIAALFDLKTEKSEIEMILDKYFEFNYNVNTSGVWTEFYGLMKYSDFELYIQFKHDEIISMFKRGNLNAQALYPFIIANDNVAKTVLREFYDDILLEDPLKAEEIKSTGLLDFEN